MGRVVLARVSTTGGLSVFGLAVLLLAAAVGPVAAQGNPGLVILEGVVELLPGGADLQGEWVVAGKVVHVTADTLITHPDRVSVGVQVKVLGQVRPDGSVAARLITVVLEPPSQPTETFVGVIESLPGTPSHVGLWSVSGRQVAVTDDTEMLQEAGQVEIGARVVVHGVPEAGGGLEAERIVVLPGQPIPPQGPVDATILVLHLEPTDAAPEDAEGVALARLFELADNERSEDLKVAVSSLLPDHLYDVEVDAFHAGSILTDGNGQGLLFLSSRNIPGAEPLPGDLRPVTELGLIEVLDSADGLAVLVGHFDDARRVGRNPSPGAYTAVAPLFDEANRLLGKALALMVREREDLHITVWRLDPLSEYTIFVDALELDVVTTDEDGNLRSTYSSVPRDGIPLLPEEFRPVSALVLVEIRDSLGEVVASGSFLGTPRAPAPRPGTRPVAGRPR